MSARLAIPRLVIAGAWSGSGKTTVSTGLMAALGRRGLRVQGFKVGPDYIDPTYHQAATGRPSRNLDLWLMGAENVLASFVRAARDADLAVIEGVMGLHDGRGPSGEGSTAQLARLLEAPVILVVDVKGMGRSAAALVAGYRDLEPGLNLAGVILNRAGSAGHAALVAEAVAAAGVPVLGWLPADAQVARPERHLGLVPAGTGAAGGDDALGAYLDRLAALCAERLDLDALVALARRAPAVPRAGRAGGRAVHGGRPGGSSFLAGGGRTGRVRLAVAWDAAFHFYYRDALDLLEELGADVVTFSPLADCDLPADSDGLLIGGGFPELHAADLAANVAMQAAVRRAAAAGMPIYAECGGFMYLCRSLIDGAGREFPMVGLVPARAVMTGRLAGFGYKEATALRDTLLLPAGGRVRGHEFHYARLEWDEPPPQGWPHAYLLRRGSGAEAGAHGAGLPDGWAEGGVLASFLHVHLGAEPRLASRLVERMRAYRAARLAGAPAAHPGTGGPPAQPGGAASPGRSRTAGFFLAAGKLASEACPGAAAATGGTMA